jgi:hypothetical protein
LLPRAANHALILGGRALRAAVSKDALRCAPCGLL